MDSILAILGNIPEVFLLGENNYGFASHSWTREQKVFLVNFVTVFNVNEKELCLRFKIPHSTFKNWKINFNGISFDVYKLLTWKWEIPVASATTSTSTSTSIPVETLPQSKPTMTPIQRRKSFGSMIPRTRTRIIKNVKKSMMSYSSQLPDIADFSKEDQDVVLQCCWKQLEALPDSDQHGQQLNNLMQTFQVAVEGLLKQIGE